MVSEERFREVALTFAKGGSCGIRLVWLVSLPLLLLLFALAGYTGLINFKVEVHSVVMIGVIFVIYLFFMTHNAYYASCRFRRDFGRLKSGLADYVNANLLAIGGIEKANVPLEPFFEETADTLRNDHFSSVAAGIFPTMGILGPFISIAISMPDFSAHTSEILEQEISKLLGGVGTAFYVSIYGIFLSLWWIFFEKSGVSRFQRDTALIKAKTRDLFWGKEEIEQTYFRSSMAHYQKLDTLLETIGSGTFTQDLNRTLEERMHIFQQVIAYEQKAADRVATLLEESAAHLETFTGQQARLVGALEPLTERLLQFGEQLQAQEMRMSTARETLGDAYAHTAAMTESLGKHAAALNEALASINAQNVQQVYSGVLENIDTMKQQIDRVGSAFEARMDSFDARFLEKLQQTLKLIDSETALIVSQIAKLKSDGEL